MRKNGPEKKVALIIEDDESRQKYLKRMLEEIGWVVFQAMDMDSALELVAKIENLGASLTLLDGYLKPNDYSLDAEDKYEAEGGKIAEIIKTLSPHTVILGISGIRYYQDIDNNIDEYTGKLTKTVKDAILRRKL